MTTEGRDGRGDELSRRELERQIADLRRDKVRIDDNLRRMEANQKRIFGELEGEKQLEDGHGQAEGEHKDGEEKKVEKKPDADDEEDSDGEKRKKEEKDDKDGKEDKEDDEEDSKKRKRDEEDRKKKEGRPTKTDARSRNLFGKLLGHLHSAKERLNKEKSTKMSQLQQAALGKVEAKVNMNRMNIKEFRRGQFAQQMKEEEVKAKELDKMIAEKELLLLQRRLESHYGLMMNFIRTKAQPTIFFLPAKHTRDTEKQLEETRAAIKAKIASLKVQLQQVEEDGVDPERAARNSAAEAAMAAAEAGQSAKEKDENHGEKEDKKEDEAAENGKEKDEPDSKKRKTEKKEDSDSEAS